MASVAVVTTGRASSAWATRSASALAPPSCPPVSETAKRRASSTQTTPGSLCLSVSSGAISRTVAPAARKHTNCSHSDQARAIDSPTVGSW